MTLETLNLAGYKPAEIADQPQPMLIWAELADLVIDRSYQRSITPAGRTAIQRIANSFDWRKYQPILVAPTDGGKLAVVDGQHRAHAAALCGIAKLPAMTVPMTPSQQAAGFAAINRDRIKMNPLSIYRAELAAGTEWAVGVKTAVEAAGCAMAIYTPSQKSKTQGTVYSVALIRKMIANGEADAVTAGLRAIRASEMGQDIQSYNGATLAVWLPAIAHNQRFLHLDLSAVFEAVDIPDILDVARAKTRQDGIPARRRAIAQVVEALNMQKDQAA